MTYRGRDLRVWGRPCRVDNHREHVRRSMIPDTRFDEVLAAAQSGDDRAAAVLYRDLQPTLLRYLRTKAPDVAEDLASEVWLAAATHLPAFSGNETAFRRWMFTMARNRVLGHWRQLVRRATSPTQSGSLTGRADPQNIEASVVADLSAQQ